MSPPSAPSVTSVCGTPSQLYTLKQMVDNWAVFLGCLHVSGQVFRFSKHYTNEWIKECSFGGFVICRSVKILSPTSPKSTVV